MKKHKSEIKSSTTSGETEVFVLPPDILEKLGIQLSQITGQNEENGDSLARATKYDEVDLPNSIEGSSILETANLMKKSLFLSPTFVSASNGTPNELNGISNTATEIVGNLLPEDNESFKDNNERINNNNQIQSKIDEITSTCYMSVQTEDLEKCEYITKKYKTENTIISSNSIMNASQPNEKKSPGNNSENVCLSDCSQERTNNNFETKEKQKIKHKIKIISQKILNHSDLTLIQNSQRTSDSFLVPVNTIVAGKTTPTVDQNYLTQDTIEKQVICISKEMNTKIDVDNEEEKNYSRSKIQNIVGDDNRNIVSESSYFTFNEVKIPSTDSIYSPANHEEENTTMGIKNNENHITTDILSSHDSYANSLVELLLDDEKLRPANVNADAAVNSHDMAQVETDIQITREAMEDTNKEIFSNTKNNIIKSKLCIQGVEKPGGSRENNVAEVLKTYQRIKINKSKPENVIFDSTDITYSKLPNNIDIQQDDINIVGHENANIFCVCHDFGQLSNYDSDIMYEHIHFWNHIDNNCDLEILLSIYDDISSIRELNITEDFDVIDDDVETIQNNICWLSFDCEDCEESETQVISQSDIMDDSTIGQPIRRSARKRKATATEQVIELSEPKSKKTIKCGACGLMLSEVQWNTHIESEHNSIAWKDGQTIDLGNKKLLKKLGLKLKQLKYLRCTFCKADVKNSVKKYIEHIKLCIKRKVDNAATKGTQPQISLHKSPQIGIQFGESYLQNLELITRPKPSIGSTSKQINDLIKSGDDITFSSHAKLRKCSQKASMNSKNLESTVKHTKKSRNLDVTSKSINVEVNPKIKKRSTDVPEIATLISLGAGISTRSKRTSVEASSPLKNKKKTVGCESLPKNTNTDAKSASESVEPITKLKRCIDLPTKSAITSSIDVSIDLNLKKLSKDDEITSKLTSASVDGKNLFTHQEDSKLSIIPKPKNMDASKRNATEFQRASEAYLNESPSLVITKSVEHEGDPKSIKTSKHVEVQKSVGIDNSSKLKRHCSDLFTKPSNKHGEVMMESKHFVDDQGLPKSSRKVKHVETTLKTSEEDIECTRKSSKKSVNKSTIQIKEDFKMSPELKGMSKSEEISSNTLRKCVSDENFSKPMKTDNDLKVAPNSGDFTRTTTKATEIFTKSTIDIDNAVAVSIKSENMSTDSKTKQNLRKCDKGVSNLTKNKNENSSTSLQIATLKKKSKDIPLKSTHKSIVTENADKSNKMPLATTEKSNATKIYRDEFLDKHVVKSAKDSVSCKLTKNKDVLSKSTRQLTNIDIFATTSKPTKVYSNTKKQTKNTCQKLTDAKIGWIDTQPILENKPSDNSKSTQDSSNGTQASFGNTHKENTSNDTQPDMSAKSAIVAANKTVSCSKKSFLGIEETVQFDDVNKETPTSPNQNETDSGEEQIYVVSIKEEISLCGVCKQGVEDSQWVSHIAKEHNYLAWREGEPPLDLHDEAAVRSHLYAITKANGGLKCSKCGVVRKYVKTYMMHVRECDGVSTQVADVSSYSINDSNIELDTTYDPDDAPLNTYSRPKMERKDTLLDNRTVVCGVCSLVVLESKWIEHIRLEHKYLAWKSNERPLNLDDEAEVKIHLQNISKYHHGLKCSKCGIVRLYVKKYLDHESTCTGPKNDTSMLDDTLNASSDLDEIENLPENVKCGKCGKEVKGDDWMAHIEKEHNYLAWIEGKPPLDENDSEAVFAHLHRLVKKRGALLCVKCGLERKYPKAFLTHVGACEISGFSREEYFVDVSAPLKPDEYECAVCHEIGNRKDWKKHAMNKHYNIAWMAGEMPINLKNPYAVEKYLKEYRRKHELVCKVCRASRVSCFGFYAHILTCGKDEKEQEHLMNMCDICNNKYLCIYRNQHMAMHREKEYRKEQKLRDAKAKEESEKEKLKEEPSGKRRAAEKAKKVMETYTSNRTDDGSHVCGSCHIGFDNESQLKEHTCAQDDDGTDSDASVKMEQESDDDDGDDEVDSNISNEEEEDYDRRKRCTESIPIPKLVLPYKVNDFNYYLEKSYENFREKHLTKDRLFDSWRHSQYQIVLQEDVAKYLPTLAESCKIRVERDEWNTYKRFEGRKKGCGRGLALFTGASIRCMQWAPSCVDDDKQDHYLAIACFRDADCPRYGRDELPHHPGLLQIWNIGQFATDPKLVVGLAHDFGTVWAMDWCPSGARDKEPGVNQEQPFRLGLLAVACSNGSAYILDVPCFIMEPENEPKIIKVEPVAELRFSMTPQRSKYQATSISWSPKKCHSVIMVGYSDGSTALYDLNTNSPFLKSSENGIVIYYPFEDMLIENSTITGVSLSTTNSDHVVGGMASSSVTGATMTAWPAAGPVVRSHLSASSVIYTPHWPAALLCSDDVLTMKSTNEMEWWGGGRRMGGACAAGACVRCGRVCLTAPPFVRVLRAHPCYPELKKQIVATVKMVPLAQKRKMKLTNDDLGMIVEPLTYEDTIKKYGLEFKLVPKKDQKIASKLCDNAEQCPERFPLSDLPAAGFCPSDEYHHKLAVASHAGFVFIISTT